MYSGLVAVNQLAWSDSLCNAHFAMPVGHSMSGAVQQASTVSVITQKNLSSPTAMISTKNNSESPTSKKSESERRAINNITTPDTTPARYVTVDSSIGSGIAEQQQFNHRRNLPILSRK
jgi:hypothetical protein